jgi:hypothetical protein
MVPAAGMIADRSPTETSARPVSRTAVAECTTDVRKKGRVNRSFSSNGQRRLGGRGLVEAWEREKVSKVTKAYWSAQDY